MSRAALTTSGDLAVALGVELATIRSIAARARRAGVELRRNGADEAIALYDLAEFLAYVDARPGRGWRGRATVPA